MWEVFSLLSFLGWLALLLVPWQPWRCREQLHARDEDGNPQPDLSALSVLIPARNEADVLAQTLTGVWAQGSGLRVLVIDDQSTDETAATARRHGGEVVSGEVLPADWTGKLWALEQGLRYVQTPWVLLLDADIQLERGALAALWSQRAHFDLQSVMATLRMVGFWERALMPAFIFFFKLIYPFALSNTPRSSVAAAAGGCVLVRTEALRAVGGFETIKSAVIDDCALAKAVKRQGFKTWVGLSHAVVSTRAYATLASIWHMVARTAYSQLRYSPLALMSCTVLMGLMFWVPPMGLLVGLFSAHSAMISIAAVLAMCVAYQPTLYFYGRASWWGLALPAVATLYLVMTWHSAWRYWRGLRTRWKRRDYPV